MQRTIVLISAGLSVPSSSRMLADQLSAATQTQLRELGTEAVVQTVELRDYAVDIANNMVTGFAPPALARVLEQVALADALIAVTPIFSASYSGLFKSFFDLLEPKALDGLPVLIGATGGSTRHSLVLETAIRPLFSYFRAQTVATAVFAAPQDWGAGEAGQSELNVRIAQAAGELATAIAGQQGSSSDLPDHRLKRESREQEKMVSLPFEQLLAQIAAP
ncbi:FMN reductase [Paenarthrobacter sp. Z7-10]|uniref:FMN reductase n=1 Tax=Paenarthrobacter sp. Z7-10 TaxID=2787635 RepID=UPI0022A8EDBE|nr:FMN reductase [Paenarthrobacter sp. Z7-10]MCZ2404027.1 FMN reductase [Paenarthrobacter sp. Z7-10]